MNVLAFLTLLWPGVWQTVPEDALASCYASISGLYGEQATPLSFSGIPMLPMPLNCSTEELRPILNAWVRLLNDWQGNPWPLAVGMLSVLVASSPWEGCSRLLQSLLTPTASLEAVNFTACSSGLGTAEFAVNPCWNATVAQYQCCLPAAHVENVTR